MPRRSFRLIDTESKAPDPLGPAPVDAWLGVGQPAATGTGFSMGTPTRLPYSVQLPS
jgi:hypothetical protein